MSLLRAMITSLLSLVVAGSLIVFAALPAGAATYTVRPGQVGAAKVGMTVKQAMRTGQFNRDVEYVVPGVCRRIIKLQPKGTWKRQYDVIVRDGRIKEMGVLRKLPRTANNSGIGTTLRTLRARYGSRLSAPQEAGYGQWAVFVHSNHAGADRRWIGFLFGRALSYERKVRLGDTVTFMAVTRGKKPKLVRDGC